MRKILKPLAGAIMVLALAGLGGCKSAHPNPQPNESGFKQCLNHAHCNG